MPWSLEGVLPCRRQLALEDDLNALTRLDDAPQLGERIVGFLGDLVSRDPGGGLATRLISAFNDRLTIRVIELTARRHRLPAVSWCWLALGSEGRHEQTFVSDQDNGLVFSATGRDEAAALRELFVPFARAVNRRLADCGFPLCRGEVMAGNPAWCLSLEEWRECFIDWVRRPDPQALLNASIFFDLAPLYGDAGLAEKLRSAVLSLTVDAPAFLHLMAANALNAPPPLNYRGELVADGGEIDLKKFGTRIFVDAARIFALAAGARAVNTSARLHDAGLAAGLQAAEVAAVEAAFAQLLRLRLAHQLVQGNPAGGEGTGIPLGTLNEFDRAILRESLKQARRLQQRLKLNYAL